MHTLTHSRKFPEDGNTDIAAVGKLIMWPILLDVGFSRRPLQSFAEMDLDGVAKHGRLVVLIRADSDAVRSDTKSHKFQLTQAC